MPHVPLVKQVRLHVKSGLVLRQEHGAFCGAGRGGGTDRDRRFGTGWVAGGLQTTPNFLSIKAESFQVPLSP